jgi:hypothetical protein
MVEHHNEVLKSRVAGPRKEVEAAAERVGLPESLWIAIKEGAVSIVRNPTAGRACLDVTTLRAMAGRALTMSVADVVKRWGQSVVELGQ